MNNIQDLKGKRIINVRKFKADKYDDTGYIILDLNDGEQILFVSCFGGYTGESIDEYPTDLNFYSSKEDLTHILDSKLIEIPL